MKHTTLFLTLLAAAVIAGCGPARPADLPPLVPCKIKVHDGGSPLANIGVSFQRVTDHGGWSLNGQTDPNGVAVAKTSVGTYLAAGIPAGTYRITLSEHIEIPDLGGDYDPETPAKVQKFLAENRKLPAILYDPSRTPLELTVGDSGAELDIDVAQYK